MNKRLRELREFLGLNQLEFGAKINIAQSTCAQFEAGNRVIRDVYVDQICHTFNVNEEWLRTGKGEMFVHTNDSILSSIAGKYDLDELDCAIIENYLKLPPSSRAVMKSYLQSLVSSITADQPSDKTPPAPSNLRHIDGSAFAPGEEIPETIRRGVGDQPWDPEEDVRKINELRDAADAVRAQKRNQGSHA